MKTSDLLSLMLLAGALTARGGITLTTLVTFGGTNGSYPGAALIQTADGDLYGTLDTVGGPQGIVRGFRVTTNGILTLFHIPGDDYSYDGHADLSRWVQRKYDGNLYCTAASEGVLEYSTNGASIPLWRSSSTGDATSPFAGLIEGSDGNFYGTSASAIFQVTFNGRITVLYSFTGFSDGGNPVGGLVQTSDGTFYGTTAEGGWNNAGTVFKITTNGILTTLYSFTGEDDGYYPSAALVQGSDGYLYGTTEYGGTFGVQDGGYGTVFRITTNGALTTLFSFNGTNGANPVAPLIQGADGSFYGTAAGGGNTNSLDTIYANGSGTIFKFTPSGAFTTIYSFSSTATNNHGNTDGANPTAALVQVSDGSFYGTTLYGGTNAGAGTVFRLSITADSSLKFTSSSVTGNKITFAWNAIPGQSYQLQSNYALTKTNWMSCGSVITATNATATASDVLDSAGHRFYRLLLVH